MPARHRLSDASPPGPAPAHRNDESPPSEAPHPFCARSIRALTRQQGLVGVTRCRWLGDLASRPYREPRGRGSAVDFPLDRVEAGLGRPPGAGQALRSASDRPAWAASAPAATRGTA